MQNKSPGIQAASGPVSLELARCLVGGGTGGACLDVFENEPNVPKELFAMENDVLSPCRALYSCDSFQAAAETAMTNHQAFYSSKPLHK